MLDVAENAELEQYLRACVSVFNPRSVTECSLYHTTGRRDYVEKKKKIIAIEKGGGGYSYPDSLLLWYLRKREADLAAVPFRAVRPWFPVTWVGRVRCSAKAGSWCKWPGFQP